MTQDQVEVQPRRVGVREFRGSLTGFLRQAREGQSFFVTSRDEVLAELRPPPRALRTRRRPAALRGKLRMAPDFDVLLPDVLAIIVGEERWGFFSTPTLCFGGWMMMTVLDGGRGS